MTQSSQKSYCAFRMRPQIIPQCLQHKKKCREEERGKNASAELQREGCRKRSRKRSQRAYAAYSAPTVNNILFITFGDLFSGSDINKFTPASSLRFSKMPNISVHVS